MVIALVALVAIACGTDDPGSRPTAGPEATPTVGPISTPIAEASDITRALGEARVRWDALGLVDYEFRTNWVCFCLREFNAQVDLEVRDGVIVGGVYAPETGFTSAVDLSLYETVKGLFDIITDAIVRDAHKITATYHPEYGYPESVFIDYDERIADEERGFAIQKLTAPELASTAVDELSEGDPPPADAGTDEGQLAIAQLRWKALDISDYDVTMTLQCFCPFGVSKAADLKVRDGVITKGLTSMNGPKEPTSRGPS